MKNELKNELRNINNLIEDYYSNRVTFRHLAKSDSFPLFVATKNPDFNKYLAWKKPEIEKEVIEQINYLLRERMQGECVVVSMTEKETGKWMGLIKYTTYKDSIMISLWCHPDYWGNRNIIVGILGTFDIIFENTNINKIYLKHHVEYEKMKKIALGVNFEYLYDENYINMNGTETPCKTYCLKKENHRKIVTLNEY